MGFFNLNVRLVSAINSAIFRDVVLVAGLVVGSFTDDFAKDRVEM